MSLRTIGPVEPGRECVEPVELPCPRPGPGEVLIAVSVCGVCHTELDEIEGRLPPPTLPVIPGHQVVGTVAACGPGVSARKVGDRVGVAWIGSACGRCPACEAGTENLCPSFAATGRDRHGGYAEFMTARADFTAIIPPSLSPAHAAPLLCAGAIGYRSWRLAALRPGGRLGLTGFGASAHLVLKLVRHLRPECEVFVFARSESERAFALDLGACWAGDTAATAPAPLDAIIDTTPAWTPVIEALRNLAPGGRLVINAIRKESRDQAALGALDYPTHLWMEKEVKSVANVARRDVEEFLAIASAAGLQPDIEEYGLGDANRALLELKQARIRGAKVLRLA